MAHKVKYTRQEYREEYLQSEEWKTLRKVILNAAPTCQCCDQPATDVHHMVYRNIVDIKITDLLPVCRNCHKLIHVAIDDKWISQELKDLAEIREKTLKINFDDEYKAYSEWINSKHVLSDEERKQIEDMQGFIIQKISGLVKRNVWYDKLDTMKFTGRQILKIRGIIQMAIYRRNHKIDIKRKSFLRPKSPFLY